MAAAQILDLSLLLLIRYCPGEAILSTHSLFERPAFFTLEMVLSIITIMRFKLVHCSLLSQDTYKATLIKLITVTLLLDTSGLLKPILEIGLIAFGTTCIAPSESTLAHVISARPETTTHPSLW